MVSLFKKFIELGFIVSGKPTVWEYTDGCKEQYRQALAIYSMTLLPDIFGIIMYHGTNTSCHRNNLVGGVNANEKWYLK